MLADGDLLWIFFFPLAFAYIIHVIFFGGVCFVVTWL